MAIIVVKNAVGLGAAIQNAKAGDTIKLAAGDYGDVKIYSKTFTTDVTITSADANNPAVMRSLLVHESSGINIDNVDVNFTPTHDTALHHSAVRISGSTDIALTNGQIKGGPAISGVPQSAMKLDATGNVLGLPTARGVKVEWSKDIRIENNDVSNFHKGIVLNDSSNLSLRNNSVHDVRTGTITGSNLNNITVDGNELSNSTPWRLGATGDHADFIHFWTDPKMQDGANKNITITNNKILQGDGSPIMGIYLDDNGVGLGFTGVNVSNNVIIGGHNLAITLENVFRSKVIDNVLLQSSGGSHKSPGIALTNSHGVEVTGNLTSYIKDTSGTNTGFVRDNVQVQKFDPTTGGYYTESLINNVLNAKSAEAVKSLVLGGLTEATSDVTEKAVSSFTQTASSDLGVKIQSKGVGTNFITGGKGGDTLLGGGANDSVSGGAGNDLVSGAAGADNLRGGLGADTFTYNDNALGAMDTIFDFSAAQRDKINVHSIDANSATKADDDFRFIGTKGFSGVAGELRYEVKGGDAYLMGDVNADGVADFMVKLIGVGTLTKADLSL